jgi:AraC-like DNA-binding protein
LFVTPRFLQSRSTPTSNLEACFKSMGGASRVLKLDVDTLRDYLKPLDQSPAKTFGADILFENHLLNFLIFLNQVVLSQDAIATPKNTIKNKTIRDLIEYINDHLDGDLTLDTIAETFFTNKYYISREFKKQTGFTFHTYVLKKRLLFSKQLLRQFESASEVYRQCGFNSYTHFLRCFKQEFHLTPKEFLAKEKQVDFVQYDHSKY